MDLATIGFKLRTQDNIVQQKLCEWPRCVVYALADLGFVGFRFLNRGQKLLLEFYDLRTCRKPLIPLRVIEEVMLVLVFLFGYEEVS